MIGKTQTFDGLKRVIYLWTIPFVLASLVIYNVIEINSDGSLSFNEVVTRILFFWYLFFWISLYRNRFFRLYELSNLAILTLFHLAKVFDEIFNHMAKGNEGALGLSVIWVPSIIIIIFLTLRGKLGLFYSLTVFLITLAFGLVNFANVSSEYIISLNQFYFAYIVYILIFYFAQDLFRIFADLEVARRSALTDALTGIANRNQINSWLEDKIENAERNGFVFSIMFFDIDCFKKVNDMYGHQVGDYVLIEMSNLIKANLLEKELFGRWGGEEFMIISHGSKEKSAELAELIRVTIEKHNFNEAGKQTLSFGVASYRFGETLESLINRVDYALYESKQNGRNRITVQ